jgi:nicotinic acid mononucleotide adenylyltransferase
MTFYLQFLWHTTVWILPVYQHMFIGKRSLESFDHRLAMCKLCFEALGTPKCVVRILPIERDAYMAEVARNKADPNSLDLPPARLGTIDIVNYIKQDDFAATKVIRKEASNCEGNHAFDLHLVLGYDTFLDLMKGKWKDAVRCDIQILSS